MNAKSSKCVTTFKTKCQTPDELGLFIASSGVGAKILKKCPHANAMLEQRSVENLLQRFAS